MSMRRSVCRAAHCRLSFRQRDSGTVVELVTRTLLPVLSHVRVRPQLIWVHYQPGDPFLTLRDDLVTLCVFDVVTL